MNTAVPITRTIRAARQDRGYALVLIMFLLFLLVLSTIVVMPNVITEGRREKEDELIWRGKQYSRGIRLYYQKLHHYPNSMEELTKEHMGVRFMRQPFKDPMNTADGKWRLIYVGPSGQLIGSLKNSTINLTGNVPAGFSGSLAGSGSSPFGGSSGQSAGGGSMFAPSSFGSSSGSSFGRSNSSFGSGFGSSSSSTTSGSTAQAGVDLNDPNNQPGSSMSDPKPLDTSGTGPVIGGNIIGVGSTVNKRSIKVYDKAKNYRLFEFIWDPSVDSLTGRAVNAIPNNPSNMGTPIGSPIGGNPNQNPTQNPTQNPFQNPPPTNPPTSENPPN